MLCAGERSRNFRLPKFLQDCLTEPTHTHMQVLSCRNCCSVTGSRNNHSLCIQNGSGDKPAASRPWLTPMPRTQDIGEPAVPHILDPYFCIARQVQGGSRVAPPRLARGAAGEMYGICFRLGGGSRFHGPARVSTRLIARGPGADATVGPVQTDQKRGSGLQMSCGEGAIWNQRAV